MGPIAVKRNDQFNRQILTRLGRLGTRLRCYALATGAATLMTFLLVAGAVQMALDYTFRLPVDMRAALLGIIVLFAGVTVWRRLWKPFRFPFGPREMACLVEQQNPALRSVLISAVQFASGNVGPEASNSPALMRAVIDNASKAVSALSFRSVLQHGRARRSLFAVLAVVGLWVSAVWARPEEMGTWFDRNVLLGDSQWRQKTQLHVELPHGVLSGARGDDLEVRARADGEVPRSVTIYFEFASGKSGRETMIGVGERGFRYTFARVEEEFRFRLAGGDDQTEWFQAQLADRPAVEQVSIHVDPPGYSGLQAFDVPPDQLAVEAIKGSEVTIGVRLNKPVVAADFLVGQDVVAAATGSGDTWSVTVQPAETRTYHFALRDELDLINKRPVRLSIRVIKDAAPRVRMKLTGVSDIITTQALLPVEMSFSDVYGIARAEMFYEIARVTGDPNRVDLSDFTPGMTKYDTVLRWSVGALPLVPTDRLTLYAEAADFDDVSGPNEAKSATLSLRIVTSDELLAELARREQEYRQEFERVIEQQEELRRNLLSAIRRSEQKDDGAQSPSRIAPLERRQRQIAGQVNLLRQQFEQILAEFEVNGLDSTTVRKRLGDNIVAPLRRLVKRDLVSAADSLRAIDRDASEGTASAADAAQVAVLDEMRRILTNMLKWEGFQEAVTMLREVLRLQKDLHAETREEIERRAAELLGDD